MEKLSESDLHLVAWRCTVVPSGHQTFIGPERLDKSRLCGESAMLGPLAYVVGPPRLLTGMNARNFVHGESVKEGAARCR